MFVIDDLAIAAAIAEAATAAEVAAAASAAASAAAASAAPAIAAPVAAAAAPTAAAAAAPAAAAEAGGILGSGVGPNVTGTQAMLGLSGANMAANALKGTPDKVPDPMEEDRKRRMAGSQANVDAFNAKRGGTVKGFAKGGAIAAKPVERRRGDGISQRGRTKGRMV